MTTNYTLSGRTPVPEPDLLKFAQWFETAERHVADTRLPDGTRISTVFLAIDHNYGGGTPILFETMIFGGEHDGYQCRYSTWDDAEQGHRQAIEIAKRPKEPQEESAR